MNAPPTGTTGGTRRDELIVQVYALECFQIVDRLARWFDAEVATIMAEMACGTGLTYRFHTAGAEALPRDTRIRLGSYPDALKVYRQEIRRHGLLKGGRE